MSKRIKQAIVVAVAAIGLAAGTMGAAAAASTFYHGSLYRFRTRRRCCELQFGRMSRMGQDRGWCLFACST
jgi:hypothetical protein